MNEFLSDKNATAKQHEFIKLIVEELTKNGAMSDDRLYESPFVDVTPTGPESIFGISRVRRLFETIGVIRQRAVAGQCGT